MSHFNHNKFTAAGVLVTLGIIFGDIGTSPLYVLKAVIGEHGKVSDILIYGGLSCVFWTLTLQTTIKYVILTLRADNNGEGGVFSLYAIVRKKGHWLSFLAIIGGASLLADGMITPPISVASAIEGLRLIYPEIPTVPIVIAIIVVLFFFQRFGTSMVGKAFGPIMLLWFTMLGTLGIISIFQSPHIFAAINPYYAYDLLVNYTHGFWILGAVFLCTTGAEALYSDLGHCGRANIRVSWIFVKICLLLNYFGQGAWVLQFSGTTLPQNPFYGVMPEWFVLPGIIIATLAAIIASQALISGSFTLISEAIYLGLWPKVRLLYPSNLRGQLYVPSLNTILLIGCIAVVLYFKESSGMEAAYGLAITLTMMMTTVLLLVYLRHIRKWSVGVVALVGLLYGSIEISFLVANLEKFPHGGWFSLVIAIALGSVMFSWLRSKDIMKTLKEMVRFTPYIQDLIRLSNDSKQGKYATHLVYMTVSKEKKFVEKKIMDSIFLGKPKRSDIYWFVHVNITDEPHTMEYQADVLAQDDVIWVTLNVGFRVELRVDYFFRQVLSDLIRNKEINLGGAGEYQKLIGEQALGDFKFVLHESFLSNASELPWYDHLIMSYYFTIKSVSSSAEDWFGLDSSSVKIEKHPIVIRPKREHVLHRIFEDNGNGNSKHPRVQPESTAEPETLNEIKRI
jgi:KUP system potassium uptake protein